MTPSLRLVQTQRQTLAMTPQLMQAIKLLQMSNLELEAAVRDEVDQNPLLSLAPRSDGRVSTAKEGFRASADIDPFATVADDITLAAHCIAQLPALGFDAEQRAVAEYLIASLDDAGRLDAEILAECVAAIGTSHRTAEFVLSELQTIGPAGLFARSLQECLALQLDEMDALTPLAEIVIAHLHLVAKQDVKRLAEVAAASEADILGVIAILRRLDPRPGKRFDHAPIRPLEPDVIVRRQSGGGYLVSLDTTRLPKVLIDTDYHAEISAIGNTQATSFANQCMRSAHWLTRSLDQRARTIVKVASAIVQRQRSFFDGATQHVSPLTLREVAEDIGMHESTVSRVVSNKALSSPRGVFPFRAFFAVAIDTADGAVSAESVRARIRHLVDSESPQKVYSDDEIVKLLKGNGIVIARRTVAKYREAMNIPSSVERRRIARHSAHALGVDTADASDHKRAP